MYKVSVNISTQVNGNIIDVLVNDSLHLLGADDLQKFENQLLKSSPSAKIQH